MIKRFLFLGCMLFCAVSVNAETYLKVNDIDLLKQVIATHFPDEEVQADVFDEYRDALADNGGDGLTADDMWGVCKAGGLRIKKSADKEKCLEFVKDLTNLTAVYYQVCGADKDKSGIVARCVDTVFDAESGDKNIQVTMRDAINLAKVHAKKQYNDTIECLNMARTESNDDFIVCKSTLTPNVYYEYRFSDAKESKDVTVTQGVEAGICAIYGLDYTAAGTINSGSVSAGVVTSVTSWPSYCQTKDTSICAKVNVTAKEFGYEVDNYDAGCKFLNANIYDAKDIINEYGNPPIDNWVFSQGVKNIELYADADLDETIKNYVVAKIAPTTLTSFSCNKTHNRFIRSGTQRDDVLTCQINGKRVDFVFDDLTQFRGFLGKKKIAASKQAIECMTADGVYDGKNCTAVGKDICDKLAASNDENCPECRNIKWDEENKMCVLGSAKNAANWGKAQKIGAVAGAAVVAVVATVASGGTAAPGAWAIVMTVADVAVVAGATVQVTSEAVMTFGIFDPFVKKANLCIQNKDAVCAEEVLINELNRMQSYSKEFTSQEATSLDEIFVQLIGMLPDDSRFWTDFFGNPDFFDCTVPSDPTTCVVKENARFWQVARTVGNAAMIAGGFLKMFATVGSQLRNTQNAVRARVVDNMNNKSRLAKVINPGGSDGSVVSNDFIKNTMKIPGVEKNSQLVRHLGLKTGDVFWLTDSGQVLKDVSMVKNLWGLVPVTVGTGNILYHSKDDADFFVVKGGYKAPVAPVDPTPVEPTPVNPTPVEPTPVNPTPVEPTPVNPTPVEPTPVSPTPVEPTPVSPTPVGPAPVNPILTPVVTPSPVVNPEPVKRDVSPYAVKDPRKTGLIATAAVLGAVGTGLLVGGLVANDKDDNKLSQLPQTGSSALEKELEMVLNNANGVFFVDGNMIKLVPMPTTNGTDAKIVNINGNAVVVVDYRGHKLPYFVNDKTASWAPLLGIGKTGGWFNTYPADGVPSFIVEIQNVLNQQLKPATVAQFVRPNSLGVQFPLPADSAYDIINAEFPNGVVETFNGTFSPSDQTLYNNNFYRIKNLFNSAAQMGGFFMDIWDLYAIIISPVGRGVVIV